ncbi:preprotein translocase subunit SecA [Caballeronia udeis]|uniref:Preprotein translocase subunit SecA n=1 Tax=Caballeronia udeis TaxID=1232866 RepID=A0A158H7I1_9BURK|nr:SEC-C metal-binding domain-containing protein [Caballeronia udeis]SAL39690.1 preprotein translocase subunit SecA [Caballeronia udeis]
MAKVGRNDPCPCGSGMKYKKCHGALGDTERLAKVTAAIPTLNARHMAREHQRKQQQGLGRPIIAATLDSGHQVVAVKNRILYSCKWKTFHDFLIDYLKDAIGTEWGNAELKKPLDQRHPILIWYQKLCEQQRISITEPGQVVSAKMTGAASAYMNLAYDLYALEHNAELRAKLIARLHNNEHFAGARYELQVAAMLVRAGFTLEFEDEDDRNTSHCEFTATNTRTGKKFSVEAKRAQSGRITRQLVRALNKAANQTRIVFIDLNAPDEGVDDQPPAFVKRAFDLLRRFEVLDPQAQRLPSAYVVLTNSPWEHHLDETRGRSVVLADGFHIDEFKLDHEFSTLRAAVDGRQAHIEMHNLLKSIRAHSEIPSTFDGANPELAFAGTKDQLLIGNRYIIPDADGNHVPGTLVSAVVVENEKVAMCIAHTDNGKSITFRATLSDAELAAWNKHPETFFGDVSLNHKADTPVDFYDFVLASYSQTSKEKLLEFLVGSPDIQELEKLSQPELARVYCERIAVNVFAKTGPKPVPLLHTKWRPKSPR